MLKATAVAVILLLSPFAGTAHAIAIDATAFGDRSTASTAITTSTFSTSSPNELLLAFISSDSLGSAVQVNSVNGAGLTWVLVTRANGQLGTAEIWRAVATTALANVTVTGTLSQSVAASITVVSFTGVDTSGTNGSGAIGAFVSASGASGAPTATLVTTRANSWVFGVGTDWDSPTSRVVGANQVLVHQYPSTVGDMYWVQRQNGVTPLQGTSVTINDTAPTTDRWNLAICEIVPGDSATFALSGAISPAADGAGALVSLGGGATQTVTANANGEYAFSGLTNGTYTITPTKSGYRFTPPQQTITISGADRTTVNFTTAVVTGNPIVVENAKLGTSSWQLTNPSYNGEIEGYAGATSVNRGGAITLYVNSNGAAFTLDLYRLGWYGGLGARSITAAGQFPGQAQPPCPEDSTYGLIQCQWTATASVNVDPTWTSGVYMAKVRRTDTGKDNYLTFVVRDDSSTSDILFDSNVNTMQAYNGWGGKALYAGLSQAPKPARSVSNAAVKVSFDRPYKAYDFYGSTDGEDTQFLRWEYQMVRWLESQGYDISYSTNIDTGANGSLLLNHRIYFAAGHGEYWPSSMRNNVEAAMHAGVSLAFFAANTAYWQVRFEPSSTGVPNRVMVGFKESAATYDPLVNDAAQSTSRFRDGYIQRPENAFLGSMWGDVTGTADGFPFVVSNSAHPFYRNTGLVNGNSMPGLVGDEWDNQTGQTASNIPPGLPDLMVLSNSPTSGAIAQAVVHQEPSGALVFNVGTFQWSWGLDGTLTPIAAVDSRVGQITSNILVDMGAIPQTPANVVITRTYIVSGTISSLTGPATVTLSGPLTRQITTDTAGKYVFKGIPNGTYTLTPTRSGASFSPPNRSITIAGADVPNVNFSQTVASWSMSGAITPSSLGSGVHVNLAGPSAGSTTTDGAGSFTFTSLANGTYTVTPTQSGIVFTPASRTVTINNGNVASVNFTASSIYTVSGTITPAGSGANATVQLSGAATATTTADGTGAYTFTGVANGGYTITPTKTGFTFNPVNRPVTVAGGSVTGVDFDAQALPTYSILGSMTPATMASGASVVLSGAAGATTTVDVNGNYAFNGLPDGTYTVTPSKASVAFTPPSQTVTISGADGVANFTAAAATGIVIDATVSVGRSTQSTTVTTTAFSTTAANELLLAFIATDNISGTTTVTNVTGATLTWQLVRRTNTQRGTAEIWRAFTATVRTNVTVTATISQSVPASITVMSFKGVDTSGTNGSGAIGATGSGNQNPGAPTATLTTTRASSLVIGVGNDWDKASARTPGPNQVVVSQYLATVGDTFWVQRTTNPIALSGTAVTINDTAPATDRYNLTICEILAGS